MEENNTLSSKQKVVSMINRIGAILLAVLFFVSSIAVPVYAWLYFGRNVAGYAPISSPESLFIGTGNEEDIKYLYFSGVDISRSQTYMEYVLCVSGEGIQYYGLQFGYTTNNQFTYSLYNATKVDSYTDGAVVYYSHDESVAPSYYVKTAEQGQSPVAIPITYLNKAESEEILATDALHGNTFGSYANVNKYAEPIYWKTTKSISVETGAGLTRQFTHYYILRISWEPGKNNRETDIICIAAKVASYDLSRP
ncbi:MAG: hypothetical protein J6X75_02625 [Clostridia bacterium]|nr:hypothetical protein [Clostridia bacterium]